MISETFLSCLADEFPHELTEKQRDLGVHLCNYLYNATPHSIFILRGYAGTGKTTLVAALVRLLEHLHRTVVLLAPTGRAAKVFALNAGRPAFTIHKQIYRQQSQTSEVSAFDLDVNKMRDAIFFVDEASMISNNDDSQSIFGSGNLLMDLLEYVFSGTNCKLIFVGDNAQLPPVGDDFSPALMPAVFKGMDFEVSGFQLREVMRQAQESGILYNATALRNALHADMAYEPPQIRFRGFSDIVRLVGDEILETLQDSYDNAGIDETIVLTRSNKQANIYNAGIRTTFFDREANITRGDMVMVVRNNYYWTERLSQMARNKLVDAPPPMDFIANGDVAEVLRVKDLYEFYGLHFADVRLRFVDYGDFEMDVRVVLEALSSDTPALTPEQNKMLYDGVSADYADIRSKRERIKQMRSDPNYNALQIKYSYAVTCHKAQGGQWENVFVDQGWLPPDGCDNNYYRWLYTAMTRATRRLYLINWPEGQVE